MIIPIEFLIFSYNKKNLYSIIKILYYFWHDAIFACRHPFRSSTRGSNYPKIHSAPLIKNNMAANVIDRKVLRIKLLNVKYWTSAQFNN